ncbi:MAG: peptidyl-prolyl cis-trans isomerase [Pseudomonadota bacterium]
MRRIGLIAGFLMFWTMVFVPNAAQAWFWDSENLATINGRNFTNDDFRNWWVNWKEEGTPFPDTSDSFVEWHLLVQEAESMELYNEPTFRRKIDVFLKARTLLIYQGDKIAGKVKISDGEIKKRYEEKYLPRLRLQLLYFNDESSAQQAYSRITGEKIDVADYAHAAVKEKSDSLYFEEKQLRESQLQPEWLAASKSLAVGENSSPFAWSKGYVIMKLMERKGYDGEDFEKLKPVITEEIRDEQESRLTGELVEELKKKYQVKIDWELFNKINIREPEEKLLDQVLISMNNETYTARVFLGLVRKEMGFRNQYGYEVDGDEAFKKKLLDGVLAQTLTSRGAMDEHYEEKDPLKPLYQFYRQHRLIRELENRLFQPQIIVSEADMEKYYNDNLDRFSRPAMVSIALLEDEENLINMMYGEIKKGTDFFAVAARYYSSEPAVRDMEYDKLDSKVRAVLDKLTTGEVSSPFFINGHHTIIKLVKKTPATPMPLDHVQDTVAAQVEKQQFEQARNKYLAVLKERSDVTVSSRAWQKLKKEFGDIHVGKQN